MISTLQLQGDKLLLAASKAEKSIFLVAPFIKTEALLKILNAITDDISITIVTRWIPLEIAQGVCDLEIFDLVAARKRAKLCVQPLLHAKLYRFDDVVFVGSANISDKALGWTCPSNIELLISPTDTLNEFQIFEKDLLKSAIQVDKAYQDIIRQQVEDIKSKLDLDQFKTTSKTKNSSWIPTCSAPDKLWNVYNNAVEAQHRIVESAFDAAVNDLKVLDVIPGLSEKQFRQHIAAVLDHIPLIQEIDKVSKDGITSESASSLIEKHTQGNQIAFTPADMWEILQAWLTYFFPERYRRETTSIIFRQGKVIG